MKRHHNPQQQSPQYSFPLTRKRPLPPSPNNNNIHNNNMCAVSPPPLAYKTTRRMISTSPPRKGISFGTTFPWCRVKSLLHLLIVVTMSSSVFLVVRYNDMTKSALSVVEQQQQQDLSLLLRRGFTTVHDENDKRRRTTQTIHNRRKRPPKHDNAGEELDDIAPVPYHLYDDSSLQNATKNWKTFDIPKKDFCGMQAQTALANHGFMGAPLSNASTVVITHLLSPLGVALALRLHFECGVETIIGVDHLLPNTRHFRMKRMDVYALLQRHLPKLPKLVVPEVGIPLQDILKQHQPTHVVHIATHTGEEEKASYLELLCNMQDVLQERFPTDNDNHKKNVPHLTYISFKHSQSLWKAQAIQVVASTLFQVHGLQGSSVVGLQLPLVFGDYDEHSTLSRLTMDSLNNVNGTTTSMVVDDDNGTMWNQEYLFVEDAVHVVVSAMQLEPPRGYATIDIQSGTTLGMIQEQVENAVTGRAVTTNKKKTATTTTTALKGSTKKNNDDDSNMAQYWLGWSPTTTNLQESVASLVSLHLAHKFPYGNIPQKLAVPTPPQRTMFPCASECARSKACKPTVFDETAKISRRLTRGCKYVIYTVDLWADVKDLPSSGEQSDVAEETAKWCRVAYVSNASLLVAKLAIGHNSTITTASGTATNSNVTAVDPKTLASLNGNVQWKNWTLVFVNGDASTMSEAEYTLLKMSPKLFFSTSVARAMYVQPNRFPVPPYESLTGYFKTLDARSREAGRTKEYRSGVNIFRFVPRPAKKARRVVFSSLEASFPNVPPKSPIGVFVQDLVKREGIRPVQERLQPQLSFYSYLAHFVQMNPRRLDQEIRSTIYKEFPFHWLKTVMIVHDLREEESRQLRCEWYDEHLFWGNSHLEDLSLAYVLAKRRIMGRHAVELEDEAGWFPIMNTPAKSEEEEPERLTTIDDTELFLRILPKPRTS